METISVNLFGKTPLRGMRDDLDPSKLGPGEVALLYGFNPAIGIADGEKVGTGKAITTTPAMTWDIYNKFAFNSANGKNYMFGFATDGSTMKLTYTSDDWATTNFVQKAESVDLTLTPVNLIPKVITRGNIDFVVSNGIDFVWQISGATWPTSGKLKALCLDSVQNANSKTNFPPFIDGQFLCGRTIITDGEIIRICSPNDISRFVSTLKERQTMAGDGMAIYDDNQWVAPAAPGLSGYITALRSLTESSLACATSTGLYWVGLDVGQGGAVRLNILPILIGAGCPDGAMITRNGMIVFHSNYNKGTMLAAVRGSINVDSVGEKIGLEASAGWTVFNIAPGLTKNLNMTKESDYNIVADIIDSRDDWESVSVDQRVNINTETYPGEIFISTDNNLPYTVDFCNEGSGSPPAEIYLKTDPSYPLTNLYDNKPVDPAIDTPTYWKAIRNGSGNYIHLVPFAGRNVTVLVGTLTMAELNYDSVGWQDIVFNPPVNVTVVTFRWKWESFGGGPGPGGGSRTNHDLNFTLTDGPKLISKIRVFAPSYHKEAIADLDTTTPAITIGEVAFKGCSDIVGYYCSDIRKISGLQTAATAAEFGRTMIGCTKVNNTYYPKINVRFGKNASLDTLTTTVLLTATSGTSTGTLDVAVADAQAGDIIVCGNDTKYIKTISGTALTIYGTWVEGHAGVAATIKGSKSAATCNWTNFHGFTIAELEKGFDMRAMLTRAGVALVTDGSGNIYWQYKVQLDMEVATGLSPVVDRIRPYFIKGTCALSNHLMYHAPDDHLMLCLPQATGSTENDCTFLQRIGGGAWMVPGQHICSIVQKGRGYFVNTGRNVAKLWDDSYNYVYANAATTNIALLRKLKTAAISLKNISLKYLWATISKYVSEGTLTPTSTGALITPDAPLTDTTVLNATTEDIDTGVSVVASDGCVYFLTPYVDTTTIGKEAYTKATSLVLVKLDPGTSKLTRTNIDVTVVSDTNLRAYSLCLSSDKKTIHIFWMGLKTTYSQIFRYNTYRVDTATLGTATSGGVADLSDTTGGGMSALCDIDGVYVALVDCRYDEAHVGRAKIYKTTNYATFTLVYTSPSIATLNDGYVHLIINKDGNVVLAYATVGGGPVIYTVEQMGGQWKTPKEIAGNFGGLRLASTSNTDYLFKENASILTVFYLLNGTWTVLTTLSSGAGVTITAFTTKNDTVMLIYQDKNSATTVTYTEFVGVDYTTEKSLITSLTCSGFGIASTKDDTAYLWVFNNYWKPCKISVGAMIGTQPLQIKTITKNGRETIYTDATVITDTEIFPSSGNPGNPGTIDKAQIEISSYGKTIVDNLNIEIITRR